MMNKLLATLSIASLLGMGSANATMIDYTPSNLSVTGSNAYNSVGMSVDGIGVNVSAYTILNNGSGTISSKSQITGPGLGVYVSTGNNLGVLSSASGDSHSMDGGSTGSSADPDEGLLFSFDQAVHFSYINFDYFGSSDDFNLTVDGVQIVTDFDGSSSSSVVSQVLGQSDEFNFYNLTGTEFLFWADADSDSFRIDRMSVFAIPEPSTLVLITLGLAGFIFQHRKTS